MNLATLPAAYSPSNTMGSRGLRHPVIPFGPQRASSTAFAEEQEIIEAQKRRIFFSFRSVCSFRLPAHLEFEQLKRTWKNATRFHSSVSYMTSHPAYQRIIGMGWTAVPLMLQDLSHQSEFWFDALLAITDEQPVPRAHAGNVRAMTEDWLKWGRANDWI